MARRTSAKVVMRRETMDKIRLGVADGLQELGERVIERARPNVPDRPPYGEGLVETGKAVTYVAGKKIAGVGSAPRGARVPRYGVATYVGYDFPARFLELGTVRISPRPWLTPSLAAAPSEGDEVVASSVQSKIGRRP